MTFNFVTNLFYPLQTFSTNFWRGLRCIETLLTSLLTYILRLLDRLSVYLLLTEVWVVLTGSWGKSSCSRQMWPNEFIIYFALLLYEFAGLLLENVLRLGFYPLLCFWWAHLPRQLLCRSNHLVNITRKNSLWSWSGWFEIFLLLLFDLHKWSLWRSPSLIRLIHVIFRLLWGFTTPESGLPQFTKVSIQILFLISSIAACDPINNNRLPIILRYNLMLQWANIKQIHQVLIISLHFFPEI